MNTINRCFRRYRHWLCIHLCSGLSAVAILGAAIPLQVAAETIVLVPTTPTITTSAVSNRLLIRLAPGQTVSALNNVQSQALTQSTEAAPQWRLATFADAAALEQAKAEMQLAGVLYEPDYLLSIDLTPTDSDYADLWGLHNTGQDGGTADADIDAPEAWDITTGSSNNIVAVIDTGIDYNHPDLNANMWVNTGEIPGNGVDDDSNGYIDDIHGANFITDSGDPMDDNDHGTHVAGTIGAVANNGNGIVGVNHQVRLMGLKFLNGSGSGSTSDAIKAIDYAIAHGADVINASWGGGGSSQALTDAIQRADDAGILFVAAAGNSSANNDNSPHYPSSYTVANVLAVAATDRNDELASFSNFGMSSVDLGAPGAAILSTVPNNDYSSFNGTSMATPHVAGVAALLLAQNSSVTAEQLKSILMFSGDVNTELADTTVSGRRLNAKHALDALNAAPGLVISDTSVTEADSSNKTLTFNVGLTGVANQVVTVDYATANGTATSGSDYQSASGTLTFAVGEAFKQVSVTVLADDDQEAAEETVFVNLTNATNAQLQDSQAQGVINDDDQPALVTADDLTKNEGDTVLGLAQITVTVTGQFADPDSPQSLIIDYATVDGTATANQDYQPASGSLVFTPLFGPEGVVVVQNKPLSLIIIPDVVDEPNETFTVDLSLRNPNPMVQLVDSQVTLTIVDDDGVGSSLPQLSVDDVAATEGGDLSFSVSLDQSSSDTVTVDYATTAGTAVSGQDFSATSGTLTFSPGQTNKTVVVTTTDDALDEVSETLSLSLSNPNNATLLDASGTGTINDNDSAPSISVLDTTVVEGNTANVVVQLDAASGKTVNVNYATADGSAAAGQDFTTATGSLSFAPGELSRNVSITTLDDVNAEASENFTLNLSSPSNASLSDSSAQITLSDNDSDPDPVTPSISINNVTVTEGQSMSFTVSLSESTSVSVSVAYQTQDDDAVAAQDYLANSGVLIFSPGQTDQTITVTTLDDTLDESKENLDVLLSAANNATISDGTGVGRINDNDAAPGLSIADATVTEGGNAVLNVTLSAVSGKTVTVDYATQDDTALNNQDYVLAAGSLTFAPGETVRTVIVSTVDDSNSESSEQFSVALSNPNKASLSDGSGNVTIMDNDDAPGSVAPLPGIDPDMPTIAIGDAIAVEGAALQFSVTLSEASADEVRVAFTSQSGTATENIDFSAASGVVTFTPGEITATLSISSIDDTEVENDELFSVVLSAPQNGVLGDETGTGTISDNDTTGTPANNTTDSGGDGGGGGGAIAHLLWLLLLARFAYRYRTRRFACKG